jgi:glutamate carboxypeptidase
LNQETTDVLSKDLFNVDAMLERLLPWVREESPTFHVTGVNRMMDHVGGDLERLGGVIERVPGTGGLADIVLAHFPGRDGTNSPGILILSHLDTIHPVGTLAGRLALRRDGDRYFGPGIYDMKGGVAIAVEALKIVHENGGVPLPVTYMLIPDEEIGSPSSRERIEQEAKRHKYVLVTEPCKNGVIVTGRYAFQRFWIDVEGRPAHAGATNRQGRSAIRAMARLIEQIEGMSDFDRGMTFSVGTIEGGTFVNVMPIRCRAQVLTVAPTQEIFEEVLSRMMALESENDGITVHVERGPVRPLWQPHRPTMSLYERAHDIAANLGFKLEHGSFGGGSDGNFTGALGVATLDGLGVDGASAHTFEEHLLISSMVPRCRMFAELLRTLD